MHTPGPWTLRADGTLLQDSGRRLHLGSFAEAPGLGHAAAANARLIAAAPAMLEALNMLHFILEHEGDSSVIAPAYRSTLLDTLRPALSRATGKA